MCTHIDTQMIQKHSHTREFRHHLPCVTTSIQNPLQHPKIHPWELLRGKITTEKVCLNACMCPCVCVCCVYPDPTCSKWAPCNIKGCKISRAWSAVGDWPTKGTMGNKRTGHAIAKTQSGGYCFSYLNYPSLTPQHVNSPLAHEPYTGDNCTATGYGGHIDHIAIVTIYDLHFGQTVF